MTYRERLWPTVWIFLAAALVIPAGLLVFLPINELAGVFVAAGLYAVIVLLLIAASPRVEIVEGELVAGRARLPLTVIGGVRGFRGEEARMERGPRLDARAWLMIRGWIDPVVKIELIDPEDPTPYWIVSTRRPEALSAALTATRPSTPDR